MRAVQLREQLVRELAEWIETGFIPSARAQRFDRRVRVLARLMGRPRDVAYGELRRGAERLLSEQIRGR